MPKFAANLSTLFTELPFLDRFQSAAQAGFKAVEFLFPYDYPADLLAEKLKQHGLQQVLFNTAPGNVAAGEWGVTALPERVDDARRDIQLALEYAIALQCPSVHIMASVIPEHADIQRCQQTYIDNIRYAADLFAPYGITVMLEALNPGLKPRYLLASQYQTLDMVNRIDRSNVMVQVDLYHAQIVDGNLTHILHEMKGRYGHIQIAAVPGRHEPDEGEINYPFIFDELDKIGYSGWIGCEYNPRGNTEAGLAWIKPYLLS